MVAALLLCFFFKQKTAYEMLISDWSSDVCSSDLTRSPVSRGVALTAFQRSPCTKTWPCPSLQSCTTAIEPIISSLPLTTRLRRVESASRPANSTSPRRSEEHTSELQSLMRISYAVFCLKKQPILT